MPDAALRLVPVEEGYVFELGEVCLRVLHTPGHTPGSICLLDEEHRTLFSGDTIGHSPVFLFGPGRDLALFERTLARLEALDGFDTIYGCHGECPVGPGTIGELRACARGIMEGTLEGRQPRREFRGGMAPLEYTVGHSGIYCIP